MTLTSMRPPESGSDEGLERLPDDLVEALLRLVVGAAQGEVGSQRGHRGKGKEGPPRRCRRMPTCLPWSCSSPHRVATFLPGIRGLPWRGGHRRTAAERPILVDGQGHCKPEPQLPVGARPHRILEPGVAAGKWPVRVSFSKHTLEVGMRALVTRSVRARTEKLHVMAVLPPVRSGPNPAFGAAALDAVGGGPVYFGTSGGGRAGEWARTRERNGRA